jgi:hypothetical protein
VSDVDDFDAGALDPIDQIPPPPIIRKRLSLVVREADMLRKLLRLSEKLAISGLRESEPEEGEAFPCKN